MRFLHPVAAAEAKKKIARSPFAAQADVILQDAAPLIRLEPTRSKKATCSWLGGLPALPANVAWPSWDPTARVMATIARRERALAEYKPRPGTDAAQSAIKSPDPRPFMQEAIARLRGYLERVPRPLHFLGQIDLSEADDAADSVGLPRQGTLWFFQDADLYYPDEASWRVIYREVDSGALAERAAPGIRVFAHTPVKLRPGISLSSQVAQDVTDAYVREHGQRGDARLDGAWIDLGVKLETPKGSLYALGGGLSDPEWCRPRVHYAATEGDRNPTPEEWERIKRESAALQCLLYLETDDEGDGPGWKWGDCGAITYWLAKQAWERRAFNEARAYMDST